MSTPAGSGTVEGKIGDRRMSLGKYVKRMSSVFKREKSTKSSAEVGESGAPSVIEPRPQQQPQTAEGLATEAEATPAVYVYCLLSRGDHLLLRLLGLLLLLLQQKPPLLLTPLLQCPRL
jgi:hypothetical protein